MRFDPRQVAAACWEWACGGVTAAPACAQKNPLKDAFFGETHAHTSWSFDAYIFGNTMTGPADAYKYAKGETIKHPLGYPIKITTPLDWMGVTDHSEYVGTIRLANTPGSSISKLPIAEKLKVRDLADIQRISLWLASSMINMKPVNELVVPEVAVESEGSRAPPVSAEGTGISVSLRSPLLDSRRLTDGAANVSQNSGAIRCSHQNAAMVPMP